MNSKIFVVILLLVYNVTFAQSIKYHNFSLYNIVPTEAHHLQFLQNLDHKKYINVIFWKKPYKLDENCQLIVDPTDENLFQERIHHYDLRADLLLNDTQSAFDNQTIQRFFRSKDYLWRYYHTLEDINYWLSNITSQYRDIVKFMSIGKSTEGRDIFAISTKTKDAKPKVIVEGGIHGNEWISVEFVTYLIDQLLKNSTKKDGELGDLLNKYEWHFIPIVNPDGYDYSHKADRLWRKNRRKLGSYFGIDLNRNFNYNFGKFGTSVKEKDDSYCGPHAFSEPESKALAEYVSQNKKGLRFYFSIHGYGQKVIIPYADRIKHIDNYAEMEKYGKQAISIISKVNGTKYQVGTHYDTLGSACGPAASVFGKQSLNYATFTMACPRMGDHFVAFTYASVDRTTRGEKWAYNMPLPGFSPPLFNDVLLTINLCDFTAGVRISGNSASYVKHTHNVRYVFTFLLRDNGTYGYALPPEQILPTCEETLSGIIALMTTGERRVRHTLLFNSAQRLMTPLSFLYSSVILFSY